MYILIPLATCSTIVQLLFMLTYPIAVPEHGNVLWPLAESDHDWTTGHHLSTSPGEDPGISNHFQHTRLASTLITNYYYLQRL